MATSPNLKVNVTADTSKFAKGMSEAKQNMKSFESVSTSALNKVAEKFGVNIDEIQKMVKAFDGATAKMNTSGKEGAKAVQLIGEAAPAVAVAFAAMAAAIAAEIRAMKADLDNFYNTVEGQNMKAATATFKDTYVQAMSDARTSTTRTNAELDQTIDKLRTVNKENRKARHSSGWFGQLLMAGETGNYDTFNQINDDLAEMKENATDLASQAEGFQKDMNVAMNEILDKSNEWYKTDAKISKLLVDMRDPDKSLEERAQARAEAEALINERYNEELALRQKVAESYSNIIGLTESSVEQKEKANTLERQALAVQQQMDSLTKTLDKTQKSLTKEAEKEAAARKKEREEIEKMNKAIADFEAKKSQLTPSILVTDQSLADFRQKLLDTQLTVPVNVKLDTKTEEIQEQVMNWASVVEDAFSSVSTIIGELAGDLMTGGNAWSNFSNSALSAVGDMAIAIGRICIQTGIASEAIQSALETAGVTGWAAVAAGTALVALGAAVKAGMSNVAAGNYSSGSSVASTTGSSASSAAMIEKSITVNVAGTLRADGDELLAVISNTGHKQYAIG